MKALTVIKCDQMNMLPDRPSQVKNGKVYEGVFNTINLNEGAMTLKFARVVRDPSSGLSDLAQKPKPNLFVSLENLVSLVARDVRFNAQVGMIHAVQAACALTYQAYAGPGKR